nr:hypothetical protein [Acidobacteriota bacterium]
MQNNPRPAEIKAKRFLLFRLPRSVRLMIYLSIVTVLFIFALRRVENFLTHHPVGYKPGPQ